MWRVSGSAGAYTVVFMTPSKPPIKAPSLSFFSIVLMEQSMDMNEQMMYS